MKNNINVAVYGTLRKGFGNHRLLQNSKLVNSGWTKNKYQLTASGIPFVNPNINTSKIRVEVYSVTPDELSKLDMLEGYNPNDHDNSWYKRTPIKVILDNNEEVDASIYFNESNRGLIIKSGDYYDYNR